VAHARAERRARAEEVLAAWKEFDLRVQSVPGLAGSPVVLAIFRLDDAVVTRALWFIENPEANTGAPLLAELGTTEADAALKLKLAPPRVAWARRYGTLLDERPRDVVEFQEAERWKQDERAARAFEEALVAWRMAGSGAGEALRLKAALAAAELGLFLEGGAAGPRAPFALAIAGDLDQRRALAASPEATRQLDALVGALELRRLRFL
jgi:hypothetical protein